MRREYGIHLGPCVTLLHEVIVSDIVIVEVILGMASFEICVCFEEGGCRDSRSSQLSLSRIAAVRLGRLCYDLFVIV